MCTSFTDNKLYNQKTSVPSQQIAHGTAVLYKSTISNNSAHSRVHTTCQDIPALAQHE